MKHNFIALVVTITLVCGCGGRNVHKMDSVHFPIVTPPVMISDASERADYLALHYWDAFIDSSRKYPDDTALVAGVKKLEFEQKFIDWVSCLDMVNINTAVKASSVLFSGVSKMERRDTSSRVFEYTNELVHKYLYDPNSPFRNEDIYGAYAEKLAGCDLTDPSLKPGYEYDAKMCAMNKIGTKASDFRFCDAKGVIQHLYNIDAEWILLFFSNPGCHACMDIIEALKDSGEISYLIASGELKVLNIYIDEDLEAWRSYMPIYPDSWYNGFDPDFAIRNDLLYNVRAIPSLYVLDSQKKVIMKDAIPQKVIQFLSSRSM